MSGKSLCTRQCITKTQTDDDNIKSSTAIMRYATEYHAITISQKNDIKHIRGDAYHLSEHQLPVPASLSDAKKKDDTKKSSEDNNNVDDVTCIAHSSVCWGEDTDTVGSMEVFAMMRNSTVSNVENYNDNSTIDHNSLTTATLADERQESAAVTSGDTTILSDPSDTPPAVSKNTDIKSTSSTYYLITKSRGTNSKVIETIPLSYRPLSIHATELHVTTDSSSGTDTSVIGIFVSSVVDNKLRLYVASKDILQQNKSSNEHSFVQVSLNDTTTLDSDVQDDIEDEDDTTNDPFIFSSPIMTMDTCITNEEQLEDNNSGDMKLNRLALACYDGRVRILTYQLKATAKQKDTDKGIIDISSLEICHERCSSFLVDGPISSLHFSLTARSSNPKLPHPSLFLVAGSLCAFACIFYESALPQESFFNGPTLVVDGLFNASDDCEDSVTSVHAHSLVDGQQMIVVGTQRGRILLFGQCLKEKARCEDKLIRAKQDKDDLLDQIDQKEKEIMKLQSESELMDINAIGITASISKMQIEIDELQTAAAQTTSIIEDTTEQGSGGSIEEKLEPTHREDEADRDIHEISPLQTKMKEAQVKLASLQQDMKDNTLKIASLTSDLDTLRSKSKVYERRVIDCTLHPGSHRYRFLYEYHLPYPIHGITSSKSSAEHNGEGRDILVSTRRSFHVFSSTK